MLLVLFVISKEGNWSSGTPPVLHYSFRIPGSKSGVTGLYLEYRKRGEKDDRLDKKIFRRAG
jgi:hypothetical protein